MLKLIYHNPVFGPIHFEYDRLMIRVGRNEDNDLVLRHPSVEPYHCTLVFRHETVLWLPPDVEILAESDLLGLTGREFSEGDQICLGALPFSLAHSSKTVALPQAHSQGAAEVGKPHDGPRRRTYYCANCRRVVPEAEVNRVGLVGRSKHTLCPKCSRPVETRDKAEKSSAPAKRNWALAVRNLLAG